jgi:hypothetical protein
MKNFRVTIEGINTDIIVKDVTASTIGKALQESVSPAICQWHKDNGRKTNSSVVPKSVTVKVEMVSNVKRKYVKQEPRPIGVGDECMCHGFRARVVSMDGDRSQVAFDDLKPRYGDVLVDDEGKYLGTVSRIRKTEDGTVGTILTDETTVLRVGDKCINISLEKRRKKIEQVIARDEDPDYDVNQNLMKQMFGSQEDL